MRIQHLSLTNFRLYARLEQDFGPGLTIIQGDNAQGKTSLLEAVHLLATGRSPHTNVDRQVIRWGAAEEAPYPYALLKGELMRRDGARLLELGLQVGENGRLRKDIRIDHAARRSIDLVGQLAVVLFLPGDVDLVAGAPALRRDFLDGAIAQVDADYVRALDQYARAMAQRNALLKQAQERALDPDELAIWDAQLIPSGVLIALRRREVTAELSALALPIHRELSGGLEFLQTRYVPSFDVAAPHLEDAYQLGLAQAGPPPGLSAAALEESFARALATRRREEIARGVTLTGPHRDDLRLIANAIDLGEFGSRGQQRTAVLALKLAEAAWLEQKLGEEPVILLDEVLAELDPRRRHSLLARIGNGHQTLITTTDTSRFDAAFVQQARVLDVRGGIVQR
ncbi:MAG: DNA replication/repair protein RecF [Thermoflexales bacterium]|nr:DNA replication/repair protein RecF [Thermoflexales bacterium]